jgi:hypothetical protein
MSRTFLSGFLILLSIVSIALMGFSLWYGYWNAVIAILIVMFILKIVLPSTGGSHFRRKASSHSRLQTPFNMGHHNSNVSEFAASDFVSESMDGDWSAAHLTNHQIAVIRVGAAPIAVEALTQAEAAIRADLPTVENDGASHPEGYFKIPKARQGRFPAGLLV